MPPTADDSLNLLSELIGKARTGGANSADALLVETTGLSASRRMGRRERFERQEGSDLGLRVFIGKRQAIVSTTDLSGPALDELVEHALAMARAVPEDPDCGLAEPEELVSAIPELDSCDPDDADEGLLDERARQAEETALGVEGVTNSEGAEASFSRTQIALAGSNGFSGAYETTSHALYVAVLAGEGTEMERDYEFTHAVHGGDLDAPEQVGMEAARRAVRRLNPRKVESARVPVIYDPRVAWGVLIHLAGAINGASIARGTSFLKERMGEAIFPEGITIIDDPHRPRGLRSKPFDGEGVGGKRRKVVENGVLQTWILDSYAARRLGLATTGHAARGVSSPPSPSVTNLYLEPGGMSPQELMADIGDGFYATEFIGMGVSGVTGDYSRGAAGFWIRDGVLAEPVSEVTVAGNLLEMFRHLTPADDLVFRHGIDAPTLRIEGMTVGGT
jgi:PmbA protein